MSLGNAMLGNIMIEYERYIYNMAATCGRPQHQPSLREQVMSQQRASESVFS